MTDTNRLDEVRAELRHIVTEAVAAHCYGSLTDGERVAFVERIVHDRFAAIGWNVTRTHWASATELRVALAPARPETIWVTIEAAQLEEDTDG